MSENIPMKKCTGPCGQEYPATEVFWYRDVKGKLGLSSQCKECRKAKQRKFPVVNDIPEGYKRCSKCNEDYPATTDFFSKNKEGKYGLQAACKKCINKRMQEYYQKPEVKERISEYGNSYYTQPEVKERTHEYIRRPEVKERRRANRNKPEIKQKERDYGKNYRSHPEVRKRLNNHIKAYRNHPKIQKQTQEYLSRPEIQERRRIYNHTHRAHKKSIKGTHSPQQIQEQLKRQKHKCYYCKKQLRKNKDRYIFDVDHTFPISRVIGTDIPANSIDYLVITCPTCNRSKNNKFPWEWPEGGRLL